EFPDAGGVPYDLDVSPDGSQLVFGLDEQVHVMAFAEGAQPRRLTYGTHPIGAPVFSPDASMIAFVQTYGSCGAFCPLCDVHVISNHRSEPIMVTDDGPTELVDPARVSAGFDNTGFAADDIAAWAP